VASHESSKYSKKKRLAIEAIQSMVKRPSGPFLTESQPATPADPEGVPDLQQAQDTQEEQATQSQNVDEVMAQPSAAEIFENVRTQYFEALYLSKASVVSYFLLPN
jgi:DNA replication regulator SLD3